MSTTIETERGLIGVACGEMGSVLLSLHRHDGYHVLLLLTRDQARTVAKELLARAPLPCSKPGPAKDAP